MQLNPIFSRWVPSHNRWVIPRDEPKLKQPWFSLNQVWTAVWMCQPSADSATASTARSTASSSNHCAAGINHHPRTVLPAAGPKPTPNSHFNIWLHGTYASFLCKGKDCILECRHLHFAAYRHLQKIWIPPFLHSVACKFSFGLAGW